MILLEQRDDSFASFHLCEEALCDGCFETNDKHGDVPCAAFFRGTGTFLVRPLFCMEHKEAQGMSI